MTENLQEIKDFLGHICQLWFFRVPLKILSLDNNSVKVLDIF